MINEINICRLIGTVDNEERVITVDSWHGCVDTFMKMSDKKMQSYDDVFIIDRDEQAWVEENGSWTKAE